MQEKQFIKVFSKSIFSIGMIEKFEVWQDGDNGNDARTRYVFEFQQAPEIKQKEGRVELEIVGQCENIDFLDSIAEYMRHKKVNG